MVKLNNRLYEVIRLVLNVVIILILALAVFASIAAWINTHTILKDLSEIKDQLGIQEKWKPSFLDKDLDND